MWNATADLGGFDFVVNTESPYITADIAYN